MEKLVEVIEKENIYNIPLNNLFTYGIRANNSKRNFLFISKLLGKHLIVHPDIVKASGCLLSSLVYSDHPYNIDELVSFLADTTINIKTEINKTISNNTSTLVIGFAETATGLGESVASCIENCYYGTTTRDEIIFDCDENKPCQSFSFEEEHSHATNHNCYLNTSAFDVEHIILVDDEITTGNTMLNLIKNLIKTSSCKKYTILSILDWRNEDQKKKFREFEELYKVELSVKALVSGNFQLISNKTFYDGKTVTLCNYPIDCEDYSFYFSNKNCIVNNQEQRKFLKYTGKFGVSFSDIKKIEEEARTFAESYNTKDKKILVVGHGENIYIPSRIASYLNADFKTTSRSPIYTVENDNAYPIRDEVVFEDESILYHFYNAREIEEIYDEVLFLTEKYIPMKFTKNLKEIII